MMKNCRLPRGFTLSFLPSRPSFILKVLACSAAFSQIVFVAAASAGENSTVEIQADPVQALPPAPDEQPENSVKTPSATETTSTSVTRSRTIPTHPGNSPVSESLPETPRPDLNQPVVRRPADSSPPLVPAFDLEPLRVLAQQKSLALPLPNANIIIDKSERRLNLMSGSTLVKSYRVALGPSPAGHKQKQGDGRTPEGRFYICTRNSTTSAFHIFLGLSYPGITDAKRAVNSKQITWREYQIINQRLASRSRPLWETNLGGWIGIHGGTEDAFAQKKMKERGSRDWTAGCIALSNREIEEIHAATRLGTPVEIRP